MLSGEESSKWLVCAVKVTGSTVGLFGIRLIIPPPCYLTCHCHFGKPESSEVMQHAVDSTQKYKEVLLLDY